MAKQLGKDLAFALVSSEFHPNTKKFGFRCDEPIFDKLKAEGNPFAGLSAWYFAEGPKVAIVWDDGTFRVYP